MTENITYCENACTRPNSEGGRDLVLAKIGRLCKGCHNRLEEWLTQIPERYALLPDYLLPSAALDANPESKPTKQPSAPVPLRLAALDLLDTRRVRKWQGLVPTDDRRGALGTLLAIANEVRVSRNSNPKLDSHVLTEADTIRHGLDWLASHDSIADIYTEIKELHRELGDAVGQYPPRAVGYCHLVPARIPHDETTCPCVHHQTPDSDCDLVGSDGPGCQEHWEQANTCRGALLPIASGVVCHRCGNTWDQSDLRLLGSIIKESA